MAPHGGVQVVSLGVDLIELERVQAALLCWGERLGRKLMAQEERARLPVEAVARALALGQILRDGP